MFLSQYLVFKIVAAAVTGGRIAYPTAADLVLKYDNANKLYLSGGAGDHVSDMTLFKDGVSYDLGIGEIINKTTTTAYEVDLPSNSVHGTFGINQDATRYVFQYLASSGYNNGKFQVYSGTPSGGYTVYGSEITPFDGDEVIFCSMSADGKYILVTTHNGGDDGYKMYKDTGSKYVYHSSYSSIGSYTSSMYNPAFVPSNNNFVITGTNNSAVWLFKLYVYDSDTESWTAKDTVTPSGSPTTDYQRGMFGKGFTYDGGYFFQSSNGATTQGEVWSVDWDANTMTKVWHTEEGSDDHGVGGAISPDNRYVVLAKHDGAIYRIYENMSGDWSTTVNVSSEFDLTGSGSGTKFGSYGVGFSGYSSINTTPLYVVQNGGMYGDGKFRLENLSKKSPYQIYINKTGKYSADLKICGLDYKTNEVNVTGSITPYEDYKSTVQKIVPSNDGTVSDNDKYAFPGISGNGLVMVIVGPYDDDTTANSGGFMVYEKVDGVWTFTQQITGVGTGSNTFGYSEEGKAVQLDYTGTRVFIGDWHSNHTVTYGGSVYIYRRVAKGNWTLEQRIDSQASPQALELGFNDVNNDGDKLIIGSFGTYNSSTDEGRAWYYTRSGTTWSLQGQLASPDGANTKFGSAIGMNSAGTRVAIGAHKYSSNKGRVYIWNYSGSSWSHDATLTGDTSSQFGWDVDMSNDGNTIVVSGRGSDKVYIYDTTNGTTWIQRKEYSGYTNISSVQISGDGTTVVAGDPEGGSTQTGYSYVYIKSDGSWPSSHDKRIDSDRTSAYNGIALAISDTGDVISGAFGDNEGGTGHGAVYVYYKAIVAELKFDEYNKLSLASPPTNTSSRLNSNTNVYDIGTLTSNVIISKSGEYVTLTKDAWSNVAYFSNVTVSSVASTQKNYDIQDQILNAGAEAGYSNAGDTSQGGYGNSIDMSADGTRMIVGNGHWTNSNGRARIYHLESGSWVLKQSWDGGTRMGSQVAMNEAGTRAFALYTGGGVKIWDYSSGAWDTSASGTYAITPGSTISQEVCGVDCNKAGDVVIIGSGSAKTWVYRLSGGSWSQDKEFDIKGSGVAMNGAGTRCFMGHHTDHKVWESNYSGSSWGTETEIIEDTSVSSGYWPSALSTDSAGETLCILNNTSGEGAIYEKDSGDFNASSQPGLGSISGSTQFNGDTFALVPSKSTTTKLYYEPWTDATTHAITVTMSGSNYVINVNDTGATGNPANVSAPGGSAASTATVSAGDTVTIYDADTGSGVNTGTFTMPTLNGPGWSASVSDILSVTEIYGTDKPGISYDGTMVLFGHQWNSGALSTGGHALLYTKSGSTWSLAQTLLNPSDSQHSGDYFGGGLALAKTTKDRFVVAALGDDNAGSAYGAIYTYSSAIPDFISFDTYNKLSISSITPTSTTLKYFSNTYDIGTATNIYIESAGTYTAEMKGSSAFVLDSNVVTGTITESPIKQISAGGYSTMALTNDGHVYMWGDDSQGHLGQGTTDTDVTTPVKVKGVGGSGFLSNITKIACGNYHALALASDGTLYAWGDNYEGQLGDASTTDRNTPVEVSYSGDAVSNIAAGAYHSALTTTTGKVYCWGAGTAGEIGDNQSSSDRTSPTQVVGAGGSGTLAGIRDVSCGEQFTHAIKDSDGSVYAWGKNYYGALGDGNNGSGTNKSHPVSTIIAGGSAVTGITQLSSGGDYVLMLKSDGTVYAAGYGAQGQMGDGATDNNDTGLVQVSGVGGSGNLTSITQIAAAEQTSLALKNDGTMYSWGNNTDGQLGIGTVDSGTHTTPVAITLLTGVDTLSNNGKANHFAVTKSDGSVHCWGRGSEGQIGDGTSTADQGTPTQVLAGAGPSVDGKFNLLTEPRLTFDNYNKFSILHGLSSLSSRLSYGSNTYDIGTATSVYIEDEGTYDLESKNATTFAILKKKLIPESDSKKVVFHHGAFTASDYSSAYSTVSAAATAGHVYSDTSAGTYTWGTLAAPSTTSSNTTYTWTPASIGFEDANVLMVAGGGGGSDNNGGGGGAGGLVYKASQNLSGAKTIVVGAGGTKGVAWGGSGTFAEPGENTSFTGLDTAIGGGAGTQYTNTPDSGSRRNGGSGGGAAGSSDSNLHSGGTGTSGQGNAGGGGKRYSGGGGGGAGGAGGDGVYGGDSGSGGVGLDYSSTFGATYGEDGWFAGGGAGSTGGTASGGKGGGGDGGGATGSSRVAAQAHTGGGGSGGNESTYPNSDGGSGVVIVKTNTEPVSDAVKSSTSFNLKYGVTGGSESRMPELSIVNGLGTHTWSKTSSFSDINGNEYDWMFIGEESYNASTALTTVALPYTVSVDVVTGSPGSGYTDRIWNGKGSSTDNTEQKNCDAVNGIIEIKGTYTSAITPAYLLVAFTSGAKSDLGNGHLRTIDIIVDGMTYFSIDLGTQYGIAGDLMANHPTTALNHSLFAIKLPSKLNLLPNLNFDGYNKLTISDNTSEGQLWPPSDGTWNITTDTSTTSEWTISGASYGNGSYKATSSAATNGIFRAYQAFEGTETENQSCWQVNQTSGILSIEFPYEVIIDKYAILNRNYNISEDKDASPKDFTFEASFDGSTWVTLDTVTGNDNYFAEGTESQQTFTISNTTAYKHYRLNVTANNGDSGTVIGELKLLAVNNSTNLKYFSNTYDIGTATNIYIENAGTYEADKTTTETLALVSNVTGTVTQVDKYDYSLSSSGQQKITASDAASSDHFGRRCAISGDKMIVTASSENSYQGAAYIFTKSGTTWSQQQKLTGSGLSSTGDPQFGHGADISGNYAIVGAYEEDTDATNAGGAYIYYFSGGTWAQQARIVSSDVASYDEFGLSVEISGDYVISGANSGSQRPGSAYIFKRSGTSWTQQAKLQASDGATGDRFGKAVALSGDYAVIGAYNDTSGAGSAYIFKKDTGAETWTQQQKLTASDAAASDYFGSYVSMSGDYVIIGAQGDNSSKGAAYIFKKDTGAETWTQQQKLTASDAADSDNFGWSVSIDNDLAIIGSLFDDDGGSGSGSAYVFARDGTNWSQQVKLTASDAAASDVFGNSVAIEGDFAVVGARGDGSETGAAYIFQGVNSIPKLNFDGYKLVVSGITPTSTTLKYGSNTYDIGTATNVYIKDVGTYTAEIGNATDFAFLSNVSSGTIKTVTPGIASRYLGKMALTYDGKLYAWGENSEGEAGVGTTSDITVPTLCTGITQGTVAKLLRDSELTDGSHGQVSAIKTTDGKIHMAGKGDNFCIPGVTSDQTSFTNVTSYFGDQSLTANTVTMMSFTDRSGAALTETGNVWTWGTHDSTYKALGQASASSSSTPKQINFFKFAVDHYIYFDESTWGTDFRLKLKYHNDNGNDQYVYYKHSTTTEYQNMGIQVNRSTGEWSDWGSSDPNDVYNAGESYSAHGSHSAGTVPSGKVRFFNEYDQMYTFTNPYSGGGGTSITKITSGHRHNLALDSSGNVWFWGKNNINSDSWPSSVTDEPQKVVDGKNIIGLASGYGTMYAFDATGKMWNAGNNWEGQIGDGTTTESSTGKTLTEVTYFSSKGITINKVYGGGYFTFANTSDGYYCWGNGGHGVFGNGGTGSLTSGPVKWTHVSNIKKFVACTQSAAAIAEDGKYYAWGKDGSGERGDSDSSSEISYPKYIVALPNILAHSFEHDGYDKVFVGGNSRVIPPFVINFHRDGSAEDWAENGYAYHNITNTAGGPQTFQLRDSSGTANGDGSQYNISIDFQTSKYVCTDVGSSSPHFLMVGDGSAPSSLPTTTTVDLINSTDYLYIFQSNSNVNGYSILDIRGPLQRTKFTKNTVEYDAGNAKVVTVSDLGTYDTELNQGGSFTLKSTTVPATSSTGLYTWAFHHGNFDNAHGDGDILTARDNGRFYADTPVFTSAIGTITPGPGTSNVFGFPLTSSIPSASDYSDVSTITQGADCEINSGSLKATNSSSSADNRTLFFHTAADYEEFSVTFDFNLSETGSDTGVFFSAEDTASNMRVELQKSASNTIRAEIQSSLQPDFTQTSGFSGWAKLTLECFNKTSSRSGRVKIYINDELKLDQEATSWTTSDLNFKYFTLVGGRPDGRWALPNARMKNFKFYNHRLYDTKSSTTYTFAPPSGGLTANVMMVAGGAGGGGRYEGGGGGAGGLVYTAGTSLASGSTKTIVVGNGATGGVPEGGVGANGNDTTFTGLTTANRGGGGGSQSNTMYTGTAGSGGGGNGGDDSTYGANNGSNGTAGQGNAGGDGASPSMEGGGGGGAGGVGADASSGNAGDGGIGKFFGTGSSSTNFGDEYGDGGWFAGGGGGGNRNETETIPGGRGGGGYGQNYEGYMAKGGSQHAMQHTGGGGGGAGTYARDKHPQSDVKGNGGRGGSGIVLIQTNVAPPNGPNTAVVQVGNPRRRSSPPAVDLMGSEVNRFRIIDSADHTFPENGCQTHWYSDPPSYDGDEVPTTHGSFSSQKRADGSTSNVWYQTSYHYFTGYGNKMAQSADAIFMPVEAQRYNVLLSIGANDEHDIQLEMAADGTAALYRNNGASLLQAGTITCFTVGKWHHIALTVDSEHNAVGYVNGHPVISTRYTSNPDLGSRSGNMHLRVGVGSPDFYKFLTYEVSTYNFHMSPKQVLQRAAEVGLGPKLEYDGLNAINVVNTEPGSGTEITIYEQNTTDTSNIYAVSCESSYTLSNAATYYAEIKGTNTYTITRPLTITDDHFPLYQYPPVVTGTKSSLTTSLSANAWNTWTMSGAASGNGQYQAKCSVDMNGPGDTHASVAGLFTNIIKNTTITEDSTTHYNMFQTSSATTGDLTIQLPSAKIIRKYVLYPSDTNAPTSPYEPGSSVDPTLPGNSSEDSKRIPKSWIFKGSNNGSDWTNLDTVTNQPPSIYGDVHTISSPASYLYYRLSISANNGSSSNIQFGEWQLWGDA